MIDLQITVDANQLIEFIGAVKTNLENLDYILDQDLREYLEEAVSLAQLYVPVDTGRLRDSIRLEGEAGNYVLIADARNPVSGEPYGGYVEYGTSRMPAQPYMRPALNEIMPKLTDRIKLSLRDVFSRREVWRGIGAVSVVRAPTGRFVTWRRE